MTSIGRASGRSSSSGIFPSRDLTALGQSPPLQSQKQKKQTLGLVDSSDGACAEASAKLRPDAASRINILCIRGVRSVRTWLGTVGTSAGRVVMVREEPPGGRMARRCEISCPSMSGLHEGSWVGL